MPTNKPKYTEPQNDTLAQKTADASIQQMEAILNGMIALFKKQLSAIADSSSDSAKKVAASIAALDEDLSDRRIDLFTDEAGARKRAADIYRKYEENLLKEATAAETSAILQTQRDRIESFKRTFESRKADLFELSKQEAALQEALTAEHDAAARAEFEEELKRIQKKKDAAAEYVTSHQESYANSPSNIARLARDQAALAKNPGADSDTIKDAAKGLHEAAKAQAAGSKEALELEREAKKLDEEALVAESKERNKERLAAAKWRLTTAEGWKKTMKESLAKGIGALAKAFDALEAPINSFYEYQAKYEARLQGSENRYNKMMSNIGFSIGLSPFVKQQKMVENLQKLIDTGTNYNLELRAYIATVSENIASTFDAFDSNLMRLIRIQQNDSTAARMGMEAALTKLLNSRFSDSSYLNGTSDTVAGNLLDASAQLSHQMAAEFEFVTQKWLGALYSLGVGDQTITNIAQGLGYLGSGNIDALAGNDQLMSLLAMGASRGGASISDFLTGNLTASNTEKLLKGMVELLGDIANNTDSNKVTRAAFANVFGITNTDLRSISNLTQDDIDYLTNTNLNYSEALVESSNQLREISNRMHISSMINTLIDNAQTSSALMIGGNAATYTLYKALNVVSSLVGDRGLEIPGIQVLGTGTASGIDVLSVAKAAMAGGGLLASLIGSLGNLGSGGLPALDRWSGYEKGLERGSGLKLDNYGVQSGFSTSSEYNSKINASSDDMTKASLDQSQEMAIENQNQSDKDLQNEAKAYQTDMLRYVKELHEKLTSQSNNLSLSISDLSEAAQKKIAAAFMQMLFNQSSEGNLNNQSASLITAIIDQIKNSELSVIVKNDNFDEYYSKYATYLGVI